MESLKYGKAKIGQELGSVSPLYRESGSGESNSALLAHVACLVVLMTVSVSCWDRLW